MCLVHRKTFLSKDISILVRRNNFPKDQPLFFRLLFLSFCNVEREAFARLLVGGNLGRRKECRPQREADHTLHRASGGELLSHHPSGPWAGAGPTKCPYSGQGRQGSQGRAACRGQCPHTMTDVRGSLCFPDCRLQNGASSQGRFGKRKTVTEIPSVLIRHGLWHKQAEWAPPSLQMEAQKFC